MRAIIAVDGLCKAYGDVRAVDGVAFEVQENEIFGMVGPNGAGKTTTIECIEGLRTPDGGTVRVLGMDPQRDGYTLRERLGMQLQESALPARLRVWEALDLFASFYRRAVDWRPLLEQLGLTDKRNATFGQLSGGQKQRLFIALSLLNDPEVIFLDEVTTGLDPPSAPGHVGAGAEHSPAGQNGLFDHALLWRRRSACATGWRSLTMARSWPWMRPRP